MYAHCGRCADVISRSVVNAFGARKVRASVGMGMVKVYGGEHLDPWTIKCFLRQLGETRHRRHGGCASSGVSILSDGGRPDRSHHVGIVHMRPSEENYAPYYYQLPRSPPPPGGYYGGPPPPGRYYGGPRPPPGRYYGGPRWF